MPFLPALLPAIAGGIGAIVKGRAKGREEQAAANEQQDRLRLPMAQFNRQNPGARMSDAGRGDILANVQDYQLTGNGRDLSSTGGLRPSLFSQGTRDLGRSVSRQALLSQLASTGVGHAPSGVDPYGTLTPTPVPMPGKLDKILGGIGIAANIAQLLPGMKPDGEEDNPYTGSNY